MAPFAGRVRDASLAFAGATYALRPSLPPHAIHGTVLDRPWRLVGEGTIATDLGPDWPFAGWAVQRFDLGPDHLTFRLEVHGDEPMPASIGWHPYFLRRLAGVDGELELAFEAGAMYVRDAAGIATDRRIEPPPGPWDDTFTDLRRSARPALARLPGADDRVGLPGLGDLHRARGRPVRGAADGTTGCDQHGPDDRAAGPSADRGDDLALAVPGRLRPVDAGQ